MEETVAAQGAEALILEWISWAAIGIETVAVIIIIVAIVFATARFLYVSAMRRPETRNYQQYKSILGRSLLLSLEILVAADIVRTVALEPTVASVVVLGMLVLIRTFLSWSLVVEIEGRWPWKPGSGKD